MKRISFFRRPAGLATAMLIALGVFAPFASDQFGPSSITGMLFDELRTPVRQVPVELLNNPNSVIQRTKTDGSGRYIFRDVSSGRFIIRVLPPGTN